MNIFAIDLKNILTKIRDVSYVILGFLDQTMTGSNWAKHV